VGIGTSLFLIAVGAVLRFAVDVSTDGFNLQTIGMILMIVGIVGVLLSVAFWNSWGGFNRTTVVEGGGGRRRRVVEEEVV
jgi:hypothetical protein